MSTSIGPSYDPVTTATSLAENYVSARQTILTSQTKLASATATGLSALQSAISAYQASLLSVTSGTTIMRQAATFSDPAIGSASASATAAPGSYQFFVERIAKASQVAYNGLADSAADGGTLDIKLGGALAFTVNLAAADTNTDGTLTVHELAAAINGTAGNTAKVSASIVTISGAPRLILTASATGAASDITLDPSGVNNAGLQTALSDPANRNEMVTAQDAKVWLGAQGTPGNDINQASNTFTNIDGVSMTFTKAQALGDAPVTLKVAADTAAITANVQKFVDEYNKLKAVIDGLIDQGDPSKGEAAGVFARDGGVKVLQSRLISMLRPGAAGADSLALYGIIAARDGSLTLDSARLTSQLALDPTGLDLLIGSSATGSASGLAGDVDAYLKKWSSSVNGQIKQRQDANKSVQSTLTRRQDQLDEQYNSAYKRYLIQFTQLQSLQSQMASNTSMFDALFGDKSN